jgi:hypothetical protein
MVLPAASASTIISAHYIGIGGYPAELLHVVRIALNLGSKPSRIYPFEFEGNTKCACGVN